MKHEAIEKNIGLMIPLIIVAIGHIGLGAGGSYATYGNDELAIIDFEVQRGNYLNVTEAFRNFAKLYLSHQSFPYFTAPKVRPRTSCFWLNQPRIRIGAMAMVEAALSLA